MSRVAPLSLVFLIACGGRTTASQPAVSKETEFTARLPTTAFVDRLDDRERREQMRDWAVLAMLAHEGATPSQTAAATYQMPPVRLPYLDELYHFTYGRGRRAYLGERVLLFVDEDDPDRTATIGRLADQVRMELGEVPRGAELYVVDDRRNTGTLHITRSAIVEGRRLFSPEYGYVAGEAASADELAAWLSKTDDLSQVRFEPGKLVLGGRRFASSRTAGVTLEDVAALYQATERIRDQQAGVKRELDDLETRYQGKLWRRMNAEGYYEGHRYTGGEAQQAERTQERIAAELRPAALGEAQALAQRAGPTQPGFSLDPRWLPGSDPTHPLMLARLQQLAADPCAEISRIAGLGPKLTEAEPDVSRRSGEAWMAASLWIGMPGPSTCAWLRDLVEAKLRPTLDALRVAPPREWNQGFVPYYQFAKQLEASFAKAPDNQAIAIDEVVHVLRYYEFETGAQCARYEETAGTAVGMTLFYTDLLAKLWHGVDYGWSAPIRAIPGFRTLPRMNLSPVFADEEERLPSTRIWFGPRLDGLTRKAGESTLELAFLHRLSRVYAAGSDPAIPGKETTPNESSRVSIGWWDRHFDEVADYEPQYHRQNQIMKWSAVTAAMLQYAGAPNFLWGVRVDRTARFFPWLAAHRNELRFQDSLPERAALYGECLPLFQSYPFRSIGQVRNIWGGVSLAGRELVEIAPTINAELPLGQRLVAATEAEAVPLPKLEGRTVSITNEGAAHMRASSGPMNLTGVVAKFEGRAGAPEISVNSQAGTIATLTVEPIQGGFQIQLRPGLVEHVRAAFDPVRARTVISFEGEAAQVVRSGDTLVELTRAENASVNGSGIAVGREPWGDGLQQARTTDASELARRMDTYEWQVVQPGDGAMPPRVQFRNAPPPASAREVPVRGVDGVSRARVTEDGALYFARPAEPARAGWHGLADRLEQDPAFDAPVRDAVDLSVSNQAQRPLSPDQLARSGRLAEAAAAFERTMPAKPMTIEDRVRLALYDVGTRNPAAAKMELDALATRGHEVSPETRALLRDGLRNHGEADVAEVVDDALQGKPVPVDLPLTADRGHITVIYETRGIETVEVTVPPDDVVPPIKYFDERLRVGREGFEPDFSGSITRWVHDPTLTVSEMKAAPFDVAPGVIKNTATGQRLLRVHDPADGRMGNLTALPRVYVIAPRPSAEPRCDRVPPGDRVPPDGAQGCAR